MFGFIARNAGSIAVCAVLAGLTALIIARLSKDRKQGKSSCGGNCGHCPMGSCCNKR